MKKISILLAVIAIASHNAGAQERVKIYCQGNIHNPQYQYLDGVTTNGAVNLVPEANGAHSGAWWEKVHLGGDEVAFRCLGSYHNARYVFLNGVTENGVVNLVADTRPTGTHWREIHLHDGTVAFECLGAYHNPAYIYLNGLTETGGVNLAPDKRERDASGTHWTIER